ncbi:hypothetical protein IFR05_005078 [Cadophora sp. M221]|nr:hypothetical protein IFR05_005078 [Cadophora sp. M221]
MADLLSVLSQYKILTGTAQYLSTLDIFHLALANSDFYSVILQSPRVFNRLKLTALCDGRGLAQRQGFYGIYSGLDFTLDTAKHVMMVPLAHQSRRFSLCAVGFLGVITLYVLWASLKSSLGLSFHVGSCKAASTSSQPRTSIGSPAGPFVITNVAAIIENRPIDQLVPLLVHFSSILGTNWPIFLFTSQNVIPSSTTFNQLIDEERLIIRFLPPTVDFNDRLDVSGFLTKPWVWEQLAPAGHVLIFQADSMLCSKSPLKVDDFLQYDFVGAPIAEPYGRGYNGGLSLRNRSMALDIIHDTDWRSEFDHAENKQEQTVEFEDQWFYKKMEQFPDRGKPAARLPSKEVAMTFSVETVWYGEPMGYHQVTRWQSDKIDQVDAWCPEHRMATSAVIG